MIGACLLLCAVDITCSWRKGGGTSGGPMGFSVEHGESTIDRTSTFSCEEVSEFSSPKAWWWEPLERTWSSCWPWSISPQTSNQKLLGAPGLTTRSKDATRGSCLRETNSHHSDHSSRPPNLRGAQKLLMPTWDLNVWISWSTLQIYYVTTS